MVNVDQELINVTWWLVAATFTAAIFALVISIWGNWFRSLFFHPKFEIDCDLIPPNCEKTKKSRYVGQPENIRIEYADCYVFRILVKNKGRTKAEAVELLATELYKKHTDEKFHKIYSFIPMNLTWTHSKKSKYYPSIAKGMQRHCDLGYIINPTERSKFINEDNINVDKTSTIFSFELEVKPNSLQHLIEPGIYRLKILIAASNSNPVERTIEINHIGIWLDNDEKMFSEGIGIKVI